ncbi:uncharacterized protein LOC127798539 [Diospyros lotus]|uniref:uncharacterized protein LOC127798539 n=1 Tax=Diospyros lotus TaxID=55363 RepID=UPI002251B040|nr:uncharacterized protein LOC127798539 [Diospyros lotus]
MEEKQGGVDVSSFMLWEATGDSELNMAAMDYLADDDDDDEDAHSCSSCDYSYSGGSFHADDHGDYDDDDDGDKGEVVDQDWTEEEEEEEEEVSSTARQQKKASMDSTMDMHLMDEMERSKLFWEACLAS